jgi:arginine-tRNA-protein transferase
VAPYFERLRPLELSAPVLDELLALGWYRLDQTIFTSSHVGLDDIYRVHWLRYDVKEIVAHSSHKRIYNRNRKFHFTIDDFSTIQKDHETLYAKYRAFIDFDGAGSIRECLLGEEVLDKNIYSTKCISVFDNEKLIAGGYFDLGEKSAASILHFFDPEYKKNSLGKYLILLTIDYLRENGFEFYYPGYVVEGNSKMDYKLFLGKEQAQYFDPQIVGWKYFEDRILVRRQYRNDL